MPVINDEGGTMSKFMVFEKEWEGRKAGKGPLLSTILSTHKG
jgi:hypothetical protein